MPLNANVEYWPLPSLECVVRWQRWGTEGRGRGGRGREKGENESIKVYHSSLSKNVGGILSLNSDNSAISFPYLVYLLLIKEEYFLKIYFI
jgi:hypothetical protein